MGDPMEERLREWRMRKGKENSTSSHSSPNIQRHHSLPLKNVNKSSPSMQTSVTIRHHHPLKKNSFGSRKDSTESHKSNRSSTSSITNSIKITPSKTHSSIIDQVHAMLEDTKTKMMEQVSQMHENSVQVLGDQITDLHRDVVEFALVKADEEPRKEIATPTESSCTTSPLAVVQELATRMEEHRGDESDHVELYKDLMYRLHRESYRLLDEIKSSKSAATTAEFQNEILTQKFAQVKTECDEKIHQVQAQMTKVKAEAAAEQDELMSEINQLRTTFMPALEAALKQKQRLELEIKELKNK